MKYICKTLKTITSLLKVNQWLRVSDKPDDITYNFDTKQGINLKPSTHLWYSKGDWMFFEMCCKPEKYLSIIEVDYSNILVLTTKKDYLDFEKQYCKYKKYKKIVSLGLSTISTTSTINNNTPKNTHKPAIRTLKLHQLKPTNHTKLTVTKPPKICTYEIKWHNVSKLYDGVAIVPNPTPYFTKPKMTNVDYASHIWLTSFDVSSLAIWRQTNKSPITKSVTIGKLQDFASKTDIDNRSPKYCNSLINEIKKAQIQLNTQI